MNLNIKQWQNERIFKRGFTRAGEKPVEIEQLDEIKFEIREMGRLVAK